MIETDVVIVGGGPSGSSCAWELRRNGIEAIVLDENGFPRTKLCAGWITPRVVNLLEMDRYPHPLVRFDALHFHLWNRRVPVRGIQYSVRRHEFDQWLLQRSDVVVHRHRARRIERSEGCFVVDGAYRCTYLVGAGGTYCPVYRTFFKEARPRIKRRMITCLEEEFPYDYRDRNCYLWFFDHGLPGYAWYVPKGNGYLNIGIGGRLVGLRSGNNSIVDHWNSFIEKLERLSLVTDHDHHPRGHNYYLRPKTGRVHLDNVYVVGDSAGLATRDMGEGIGPAVESGLLAARAIIQGSEYTLGSIPMYSLSGILLSRVL